MNDQNLNHKINDLDKYVTVKKFLNSFPNYNTAHGYKSGLKRYFDYIKKNPDDYIGTDYRLLENGEKIKRQNIYENDIKDYWNHLIKSKTPPKSIKYFIASVRVFLQHYRINLDAVFWKDLNRRGPGDDARTIDAPITNEILEKILIHGETKARALFLMIASGGMRADEALLLTMDDIDLNSNPVKITIKGENTKNKRTRITFISEEAKRYLIEWLKERKEYLKLAVEKTKLLETFHGTITKTIDNDKIFPFDYDTARCIWNRLIRKANFDNRDKNTKRRTYHIHGLRKFFRTQFSKQDRDVAELLMGHEGYLTREYLRYTEEDLKQIYLKGVKYLYIFDRPLSDIEQQREIEKLKQQVTDYQRIMEHDKLQQQIDFENYQKMVDKKIAKIMKIG